MSGSCTHKIILFSGNWTEDDAVFSVEGDALVILANNSEQGVQNIYLKKFDAPNEFNATRAVVQRGGWSIEQKSGEVIELARGAFNANCVIERHLNDVEVVKINSITDHKGR